MLHIAPLDPAGYRRIPWKNGRGELVVIDGEGAGAWDNGGVAWHFGRTAIVEDGPFSDYSGYERLQVVTEGAGLVLVGPGCEVDLRGALRPQRYDGGLPLRTRLENGPVEVVNLIAQRARFDIDLRVGEAGRQLPCGRGHHVVYAPGAPARIAVEGRICPLAQDHALRVEAGAAMTFTVLEGTVLVGSIHARSEA